KDIEMSKKFVPQPGGAFTDANVRSDFVKKVYGILSVQIATTAVIALLVLTFLKDKVNFKQLNADNDRNGYIIVLIVMVVSIAVTIAVMCTFCFSKTARRAVPLNYILLITIAQTALVSIICCQYGGTSIIIAFVATGVVVLSITLLAMTPVFDITHCGCVLFILTIIHGFVLLIGFLLVWLLNLDVRTWEIVVGTLGAFLFSLWLLYDTQIILGGKKYELSPEEYIFGAISLYIDIIQIFLSILQIVGH
ncbi:unnamed protein product, partial [Medioppia subpectinata]